MGATPKCAEPISPGWTRAAPSLLRCPCCRPPDASIPRTGHQAAGGGARTCGRPSSIGAVFEPTQLAWIPACAGMTEGGAGMTERARNDGGGRRNDGGGRGNDGGGRGNDGAGAWARLRSVSNRSRLDGHGLHLACSDAPAAGPADASIPRTGHQAAGGGARTYGRPSSIGAVLEPTQLAWIPACAGMTERGAGMTERAQE